MKKEHIVFGTLAAILLLIIGYESYTLRYGGHRMMMSGMHMTGSTSSPLTHMLLSPIGILLLLLIAAFIYIILKDDKEKTSETPAIKILKERYAKGEITRDEYLETFKDIKRKE